MTEAEKTEILDDLCVALLEEDVELSLALEEHDDLRSDLRWKEIAICLSQEELPKRYNLFCEETPDWEAAKALLS